MISAWDVGTLPQWLLVTLAVLAVGRYWILGMPARRLAAATAEQQSIDEHTLIRKDYVDQINQLRHDVDDQKNELMKLGARLAVTEGESRRRGDRINHLTFIVQLVMNELSRLDPSSQVLKQAQQLLIQIAQPLDTNPAETLRDLADIDAAMAKSSTLRKAERTEASAHETVRQVKRDEDARPEG